MKKITPFIILSLLTLIAICTCFTGCDKVDKLYDVRQASIIGTNRSIIPASYSTNFVPAVMATNVTRSYIDEATGVVVPGFTNVTTIQAAAAYVTYVPAVTNDVPVYGKAELVEKSTVTGGLTILGALPIPFAGLASGVLGLIYSMYRNVRNKKIAVGLVQSIDQARQLLQTTPELKAIDQKFKDTLIEHQDVAGVLSEVTQLVHDYTGNTVK